MTKKEQIIFLKGKTEGLKTLFNADNFGYLAVGYAAEENDNGFENVSSSETQDKSGFVEISKNQDSTYMRVPLQFQKSNEDIDNGRTTCTFTATLSTSNIIGNQPINQFAICDNMDPDDLNTVFYCASTFPTFTKNDNLEISFTIDLGI